MRIIAWIAGGYAALLGGAFALQRTFIYPAPRDATEPDVPGASLVSVALPSGKRAYALHRPAPEGAPTVVHFHGNAESLSDQSDIILALSSTGLGVYAVEYPGYGLCRDGSPSETSLYEYAEALLEHLEGSLGVPPERTVLQGRSLGTGVAVEMAQRGHGHRLVLLSPFTSMTGMVRRVAPFLPATLIVRDRFDSVSKAPSLTLPALVIHGSDDEIIPLEMGKKLANTLPNARLYVSPGSHHNDLLAADGERIFELIRSFATGADLPELRQ